jgi:ferredoxin-nitrite reductase/sulfite reductase (ferredoxin)
MRFKHLLALEGWDEIKQAIEEKFDHHLQNSFLRQAPKQICDLPGHGATSDHVVDVEDESNELGRWIRSSVHAQAQDGYFFVKIHTDRGDLDPGQWRAIAQLSEIYGRSEIRTDRDQNLILPFVTSRLLPALFESLREKKLLRIPAGGLIDPVSCPGGDTCNLAVTRSRALAKKIEDSLSAWEPHADKDTSIRISGCPNSCGQHMTATIGFWGSARRLGERLVPCYELMLGGGDDGNGRIQLARLIGRIPSRAVPVVLDVLLDLYLDQREAGETLSAFFAHREPWLFKDVLSPFLDFSDLDQSNEENFKEWYADQEFNFRLGKSECA